MNWWLILVVAGLWEVGWTIGLKYSEGFTKPFASAATIALMVASMFLLGKAARHLPIGTAYGVWVGIGAVGAAVLGMVLFREPATPMRLLFLGMLITSLIGLKVSS